jgi:hypothetical protein
MAGLVARRSRLAYKEWVASDDLTVRMHVIGADGHGSASPAERTGRMGVLAAAGPVGSRSANDAALLPGACRDPMAPYHARVSSGSMP